MSSRRLPDRDARWNHSHPDQTETKHHAMLSEIPRDHPAYLELLIQMARAQGLPQKFEGAPKMLDQVEKQDGEQPAPKSGVCRSAGES